MKPVCIRHPPPSGTTDALSRGKGYVMKEVCLQSLLLQEFAKKRLERESAIQQP